MRKKISDIVIGERFRRDLGDLTSLAASMSRLGQINPVTVASDGTLLAGQRRLEAAKSLGWTHVDAHTVDTFADTVAALEIEQQENTERLAMTAIETARLASAIAERKREEAKANQGGAGRFGSRPSGLEPTSRATAVEVGKAIGLGETTAKAYIKIGDALNSGDFEQVAAAEQASRAIDAGVSPRKAVRDVGFVRSKAEPDEPTAPAKPLTARAEAKQVQILEEFSQRMAGVAGFTGDLARRLEAIDHLDEEQVGPYLTDLRSAQKALGNLIRLIEGKRQ